MEMNLPNKTILINNLSHVSEYLGIEERDAIQLQSFRLDQNQQVKGVTELLHKIPDGYSPEAMEKFFWETGLRVLVEVHQSNYELVRYDKEGRYPREDAAIWNMEFMEQLDEHPEWLEPQEEPDILVRYLFPLQEEENRTTNNYIFIM